MTETVARQVFAIPKRFSAKVTAHRILVRDRQLLALDDTLLFEGKEAAASRIEVGDRVDVVKASTLRGRTFQITGPKKHTVTALRIRCELVELGAGNRRKCAALLKGWREAENR